MSMKQQFKNAQLAIQQIKNGEWKPLYNKRVGRIAKAYRGELELWLDNGPFFCEIEEASSPRKYFGPIFRHWVWWAAARRLRSHGRSMSATPVLK